MKYFISFLLALFIFSCGIPSFTYIGGADIKTVNSEVTFTIDKDNWPEINKIVLYSRYYVSDSKESYFDDLTLSKTNSDSEKYVENKGFTKVSFLIKEALSDNDNDEVQSFLSINNTDTYWLVYDNTIVDFPVYIANESGKIYSLKNSNTFLTDKTLLHDIGNYDDDGYGAGFIEDFWDDYGKKNPSEPIPSTINIEFVVITYGYSTAGGSLEILESLPVYIETKELQLD